MQPSELLALFDQQERQDVIYLDTVREVVPPNIVRFIDHGEKHGFLIYSRLTAENADTVIRQQVDHFAGLGYAFEWKLYDHDTPADLKARLLAYGFEEGEPEALLVLEIENAPASLFQPTTDDIRRITTMEGIDDVMAVQNTVWGQDFSFLEQRLRREVATHSEHTSIYVAYVEDKPVCSAWVYFSINSQFASIWGGSTLPAYRNQGIYSAILGVRVREAQRRGYRFLYIDASPMSRPIVEKHGFVHLGYSRPMEWTP